MLVGVEPPHPNPLPAGERERLLSAHCDLWRIARLSKVNLEFTIPC